MMRIMNTDDSVVIHKHETVNPSYQDSIEIGATSKDGKLKVYFNASDIVTARERIDNAHKLLIYARGKMNE